MEGNASAGGDRNAHKHNKKKVQQTQPVPIFPKDEKFINELGTDPEKMLFLEGFVNSSSFKRRAWLWRGCLPDLFFSEKENPNAEDAEKVLTLAARMVWATLDVYSDRRSQKLVESFLRSLLPKSGNEAFVPFLAAIFKRFRVTIASELKNPKLKIMPQRHVVLLRWSCAILQNPKCVEVLTTQKILTDFAKFQFRLLHNVSELRDDRARATSFKGFSKSISKNPELFTRYLEILGAKPSRDDLAALGLLIQHSANAKTLQEYKDRFLDVYTTSILGDRTPPSRQMHQAFVPLLKSLTTEDFTSMVIPVLDRSLKRNPEVIIDEVSFLVSNLSIDLSPLAAGTGNSFTSMLTPHLASRDERIRNGAVEIFKELAKAVSSADAAGAVLKGITNALTTSEVAAKLAVVKAFSEVFAATQISGVQKQISAAAVTALFNHLKKEANEAVKNATLLAASKWLSVTTSLAEDVKKLYSTGFKESKAKLRHSYLESFVKALKGSGAELRKSAVSLADDLIALVKNSGKESKKNKDLVYGLAGLVLLASIDTSVDDKMAKEGLWDLLAGKEQPKVPLVLQPNFLGKLNERGLTMLSILMEEVVENHWRRVANLYDLTKLGSEAEEVKQGEAKLANIFGVIIYLLTSHSWRVRKSTAEAMERLNGLQEDLSPVLVRAMYDFLKLETGVEAKVVKGEKAAKRPPIKKNNRSSFYASAVLATVSASRASAESEAARLGKLKDLLPLVLVSCHHPFILPRTQFKAWKKVLEVLRFSASQDKAVEQPQKEEKGKEKEKGAEASPSVPLRRLPLKKILAFIFGGETKTTKVAVGCILNGSNLLSEASISALASVANMVPPLMDRILDSVSKLLAAHKVLGRLKQAHVEIYNTPATVVWVAKKDEYVPEVVRDRNIKQLKGQKMYKDADEAWEREVREQLGQKKEEKPKLSKEELAMQQLKLQKQSQVREGIQVRLNELNTGLRAIAKLSNVVPHVVHHFLGRLLVELEPLFTLRFNQAVDNTCDTMDALMECVGPHTLHPYYTQLKEARPANVSKIQAVRLSLALQRLYLRKAATRKGYQKDEAKLFMDVIQDLGTICHTEARLKGEEPGIRLTASALCAFLPIISVILSSFPKEGEKELFPLETKDVALQILEMHAPPAEGFSAPSPPFSSTYIELLLLQMEALPRFKDRAQEAVLDFARALKDEQTDCLLEGLISAEQFVRTTCIEALQVVPCMKDATIRPRALLAVRLWHEMQDVDSEETARAASNLWEYLKLSLPSSDQAWNLLFAVLSNAAESVRRQAGRAIASGVEKQVRNSSAVFATLYSMFKRHEEVFIDEEELRRQHNVALFKASNPLGNTDAEDEGISLLAAYEEARVEVPEPQPHWETRSGVALTLDACASVVQDHDVDALFSFFIDHALGDPHPAVRDHSLQAGINIINTVGDRCITSLLKIFEGYLDSPAPDTERSDRIRESVVIFLGTLASHLRPDDPKVLIVVGRLVDVLKTPSEAVQKAVSQCLSSIMKALTDEVEREKLINGLLESLFRGQSYGERKGAAFGIAGMVKGMGIGSLKKYGIMDKLQQSVENKKFITPRQGALFAFECLSNSLKLSFEPYVIQILPKLLSCFGDGSAEVREATADAARAIMGNLSGPGVRLVLPALLKPLDEKSKNWRTKMASVELLGSMAYCNPRQLSSCLPTIVPRISSVLGDTHVKVVSAAQQALQSIGEVIRNPEILSLVPLLIKAINDPNAHTIEALDALLNTAFIHVIDVPSLALIVPVLNRGLQERTTLSKKKAAQIVGNMCSLADHKDLLPYLPILLPSLQNIITDPIPEVRTVSSKALGTLVSGMGEQHFGNLMPFLLTTLISDAGSVERSGAAQGLSEVLAALDIGKLEELLPKVYEGARDSDKAYVREGYLGLFIYLPSVLKHKFEPYLPETLPAILEGLADETESVRDIAMRAGQSMVTQYSSSSLDVMLPPLLDALFDDNWRIRQSGVLLLGDLLYHFLNKDKDGANKTLSETLGKDRRAAILARLYMVRSDPSAAVRQRALLVWKSVVDNTPQTLRGILPSMMTNIIQSLGSSSADRREVASKTLGDLVSKLGDRVLPDIIPILEQGLDSDDADTRQGVCLGLSEVMASARKHHLTNYLNVLIPAVSHALCDELGEVREAAAIAFDGLFSAVGARAIDDIIPELLTALENPTLSSYALDGLRQIIAHRARVILPFLIPKLAKPPISTFNAKALSSLAEVSGPSLYNHLDALITSLLLAMNPDESDKEGVETATDAAKTVVVCVQEDGMHLLFNNLLKCSTDQRKHFRTGAAILLGHYCEASEVDFSIHIPTLLKAFLEMLNDRETEVVEQALAALDKLTKSIETNELPIYIKDIRAFLAQITQDLEKAGKTTLPGFCMKKGLDPVLPMFLQGLLFGSVEIREESALALLDVINLTSSDALGPFVMKITGPLIRIIGDRFPAGVKSAILKALGALMEKGGRMIKPFLPQLQTTFVKSLTDSSSSVRELAAKCLGLLMPLHTRVDPLVTELMAGVSGNTSGVQEAMLSALQKVLLSAGDKVKPDLLTEVGATLIDQLGCDEESLRVIVATSLAAYAKHISDEKFESLIRTELSIDSETANWKLRHGYTLTLRSIIEFSWNRLQQNDKLRNSVVAQIEGSLKDDKPQVKRAAISCIGSLLNALGNQVDKSEFDESTTRIIPMLAKMFSDSVNEVRLDAIRTIKNLSKAFPWSTTPHLSILIPPLLLRVKERQSLHVKLASERALLHILQIHINPAILESYLAGIDKKDVKALSDYCKRVLAKLAPESEGEDEGNDSEN